MNVRLREKHKLADKWEPDVYIGVKKISNLSVYTVRPEGQDSLLCCLFLHLKQKMKTSQRIK